MKVKFISPITLRLFMTSSVLAIASVTMSAPAVSDTAGIVKTDSLISDQPLISFIGSDAEYYYFRVQVANPSERKYEIILRDKSIGTVLYSDSFSKKDFLRRVAVPRDITVLQWDLRNRSGKGTAYENTFSISSEVKLKQDVSVTRL